MRTEQQIREKIDHLRSKLPDFNTTIDYGKQLKLACLLTIKSLEWVLVDEQ